MVTFNTATPINQSGNDTVEPVTLRRGEYRQLTRSMQAVRVISGTAWITANQLDYIVSEGAAAVIRPGQQRGLIGSLNARTLIFEALKLQHYGVADSTSVDELTDPRLLLDQSWPWLTKLDGTYPVSTDYSAGWTLAELIIPSSGMIVNLDGYGRVRVFKIENAQGEAEFWATSRLAMSVQEAAFRVLESAN
jgi:hypothetical protein